ncbi:MAG TPA: protein kinase [Kofleriaceae bacterium]|nr:protein kinase [Kofleriaceae bacterium]
MPDRVTPGVTPSVEEPAAPVSSPVIVAPTLQIPPRYTPPHETAEHSVATAQASAPASLGNASLVGTSVGDFAIEGVIGGGSFGTVYRGRQRGLDRAVAIKVPTYEIAADPIQAQRFAREARAAARIVHPGVVAIYAVGELTDGRPYLAMQLIDGVPLTQVLADGPLPAARALGIARLIASALADTHAAGVVHRDLKPSNVMWRRDRLGDDRITIVDFGIAVCRPGHADATRLTSNGLIGTPHYMSPEQAHGDHVDARADLYALGCLLFELVTGAPPFVGAGVEVLLAHLGKPAPLASERNPAVPLAVDRLIAHLMAKAPDDRPSNADAVVGLIDDALAAAVDRSPSATKRGRRSPPDDGIPAGTTASVRRSLVKQAPPRRWLIGAIGAAVIAGAGVAGYAVFLDGSDDAEASVSAQGKPVSASGDPLRLIARDDGELIVKTLVPETIRAGDKVRFHIEIRNKLGGEFGAKQVVITVEDPHHNAIAHTAAMHSSRPGHYTFRHQFTEPGPYVVRIFPSETETVSTLELDVY